MNEDLVRIIDRVVDEIIELKKTQKKLVTIITTQILNKESLE